MNSPSPAGSTRPFRRLPTPAALTLAALGGLWSCGAAAQKAMDTGLPPDQPPRGASAGWDVTLGAGLALRPRYEGADSYTARAVPQLMVSYARGGFFASPEGIGVRVLNWGNLSVSPVLGLLAGRKEDYDAHLAGLGDIPPSLTAGLLVDYRMGRFSLDGSVRQAITHQANGLLGTVSLNWHEPLIPQRLLFNAGVRLDLASAAYDRTFFGVSPAQSAQSGLPVYIPGGGAKDLGLNLGLDYRITPHWLVRGSAGVSRLLGEDGNSPVVENKTQGLVGVGLGYRF